MNDYGTAAWNITDNRYRLPNSQRVDISILLQVFSKTSASYKYLFFLSLLDVLTETGFNNLVIRLDEILLQMLVNAWYPHTYFKLSFGVNDRIAQELDRIGLKSVPSGYSNDNSKNKLKAAISRCDFSDNSLLDLVPYRLIAPFFARNLQGMKDAERNRMIVKLASEHFESIRPFYCFSDDRRSIIMHHDWMLYFYENLKLVQSFIAWNWLDYMQRRNPSVPNIQMKLFPPASRNPLTQQTSFWHQVLEQETFTCIFSGESISNYNLSLDHFLPWSFVAHDQLWNLVPVSRSINSSKSNNLPSLEKYFTGFADMQFQALSAYRKNPGKTPWKKIVEPYIADLKMQPNDLLNRDKLTLGLRNIIEPLYALASAQGFSSGWAWR
jgi:hypothetical protein